MTGTLLNMHYYHCYHNTNRHDVFHYGRYESLSRGSNVRNPMYALYSSKMLPGTFPGSESTVAKYTSRKRLQTSRFLNGLGHNIDITNRF